MKTIQERVFEILEQVDKNGWHTTENGSKVHFVDGLVHNDNDEPSLIYKDGSREWDHKNKRHRDGKPGYISSDGTMRMWFHDGKLHRTNGPAIVNSNDANEWWLNDNMYNKGDDPSRVYIKDLVRYGHIEHANAFKRGSDD